MGGRETINYHAKQLTVMPVAMQLMQHTKPQRTRNEKTINNRWDPPNSIIYEQKMNNLKINSSMKIKVKRIVNNSPRGYSEECGRTND